jgi:hypothetical protein
MTPDSLAAWLRDGMASRPMAVGLGASVPRPSSRHSASMSSGQCERGHAKVPTGGQFEGITFGQIKVPTLR